ncbi:hypothetical protein BGX26_005783 [Mortierella sp. AD094]|nr:hypothetical protein BGX26_005783 [Mortierella sp. AD094]
MEISIFDIPLIREEIGQYLLPRHLARCVLTSKEWNARFSPLLWRTNSLRTNFYKSSLARHQGYVRSLTFFDNFYYAPGDLLFPNLRILDYNPFSWADYSGVIMTMDLALQAPLLQRLTIRHINTISEELMDKLCDALESLSLLKKLELNFLCYVNTGTTYRIIESARHCESLRLCWEKGMPTLDPFKISASPNPGCQANLVKNSMDRMEGFRIRDLAIGLPSEDQEYAILVPLLERCCLLERLYLIRVRNSTTIQQVSRILKSKKHTRLKHLQIGDIPNHHRDDIVDLFSAFGSQGSEDRTCEKSTDEGGLRTLKFVNVQPYIDLLVFQALPRYFSNTLAGLDLGSHMISLEELVCIASSLPKLKSLAASIPIDVIEGDEEVLELFFQSSWVCLGIRKLDLHILVTSNLCPVYQRCWKGSPEDRCMDYVFLQIGKFTEPEEWCLESSVPVMDQTNGYLDQLKDLKELRSLILQSYVGYTELTSSDMRWMLENWPKLRYFEVDVGDIPSWHPNFRRTLPKNPVIKELLLGRPWLEIEAEAMVL